MEMRLKELRQEAGVSQEHLAKEAGVSLSIYRKWEQGLGIPKAEAWGREVERILSEA